MPLDHLALLTADVAAFAATIEQGPADAAVAACPGWTLTDLGEHLGEVHRWVIGALTTGGPPDGIAVGHSAPVDDQSALADWVREGAARLIAMLELIDPDAPTWHPFPVEPKLAGLWRRRQAQEASVHRWDAQHAIGLSATIEAEFAADGIDEYWTVMLPRMLGRERLVAPPSTIAIELTDRHDRWVIDGSSGLPELQWETVSPHATLRGDAASVLLGLWGRPLKVPLERDGDPGVLDAWLALGGA
jgi:uncharacterized protein (TIGR03083 family)